MLKNNQKGILTFDFMFSFMMVIGLFQIFYYLTFTLIAAQATQYVMFSASRNFFAGHQNVQKQTERAELKFNQLTQDSALSFFYKNGIKLSNFEARPFDEHPVKSSFRQKFVGTSVLFDAQILDFTVPFLGTTADELEGNGFTANISAFLYREPTALECLAFNKARAQAIKKLNSKFMKASSNGFTDDVGVFSDNGC